MKTLNELSAEIRGAWDPIPASPAEDLRFLDWEFGSKAAEAFTNVPPMKVDLDSEGFLGCAPLLDIPPRAAAIYLGPYMLSLLEGLSFQIGIGLFHDLITRAHLLTCLNRQHFWRRVVTLLNPECRRVFLDFCEFVVANRKPLSLDDSMVEFIEDQIAEVRSGK